MGTDQRCLARAAWPCDDDCCDSAAAGRDDPAHVNPGAFTLRLAIWDTGDATIDSLVVLDDFAWSSDAITAGASL